MKGYKRKKGMKNLVRWVFGLFFTLGLYVTSNAQTDSVAPADDAIICKQVAEDVFDCYVQEDLESEEELNTTEESEGRDEDVNTNENRRMKEEEVTPGEVEVDDNVRYDKSDRYDESEIDDSGIDDPINDESKRRQDDPVNDNPTKTETEGNDVHMEGDRTQHDDMYEYQPDANDVDGVDNGPNPVNL